jgi:hypothetical protein
MNEGRYILRIHQKLKRAMPSLFFMKIKMLYVNGVPDCWYSGDVGDIWVEYKYLNATPTKKEFQLTHEVTALQKEFLTGRQSQGRQVALFIGSPDGTAIFEAREWESKRYPTPSIWLKDSEVVEWLAKRTMSL